MKRQQNIITEHVYVYLYIVGLIKPNEFKLDWIEFVERLLFRMVQNKNKVRVKRHHEEKQWGVKN